MTILFIGTFLSQKRGTKTVEEKIINNLDTKSSIQTVSSKSNKIFRLIDIIWACLTFKGDIGIIDVFSDKAFWIASISSYILSIRSKKIIFTLRGGKLPEFYNKNKKNFIKVMQRASKIQTPSKYLQHNFTKVGLEVTYLPNPIELENFKFKPNPSKHSLLWVRAFSEIYNPELAIKILYEVKRVFADAKLTMVGPDHGLLENVNKLIKKLDLTESVNIVGPIKNEDLPNYYQTHQVYINTTSYESFGMAICEAAACGIPIVSTNVGEISYQWIHDNNMLIIDSFDPKDFSVEVCRLFEYPKLSDKIIKNARRKVESYGSDAIKVKWENILSGVA